METRHQQLLDILLTGAKKSAQRDPFVAEKLFTRALDAAKRENGIHSPVYGQILLEFADFLEKTGRIEAVAELRMQIQKIFSDYSNSIEESITHQG